MAQAEGVAEIMVQAEGKVWAEGRGHGPGREAWRRPRAEDVA